MLHPTRRTVILYFCICEQKNTPDRRVCCWCVCSLLVQPPLSHLLPLISMETGPGAFSHIHTLAINQQVRPGSIPTHTHHTDENKAHTHTDTAPDHRNIPEHTLGDLDHTSSLRGSDLATQIFVYQIWQPLVMSQLLYTLGDDCSLVAASANTRRRDGDGDGMKLSNLSSHHEWPH